MFLKGWSVWILIWNASEWSDISLGRFGPFVFGRLIGRKGERIND